MDSASSRKSTCDDVSFDTMALPIHNPRQFSIRDLLKLTLIVSIVLMVGVFARGSERFKAFSTAWTAASLVPIAAAFAINRWQLALHRRLVLVSMLFYAVALVLPAMGDDNETTFGFQAAFISFVGLQYLWDRDIHGSIVMGSVPVPVPFLTFTVDISLAISCALGAAANMAYFIGIASCCFARNRRRALKVSLGFAITATILAIPALFTLCLDSGPDAFYPGCGFWIASFLALALGTRQHANARADVKACGIDFGGSAAKQIPTAKRA
jgi:hypothetical protein